MMGIQYRKIDEEMTEQQIIETLATKVMGWKLMPDAAYRMNHKEWTEWLGDESNYPNLSKEGDEYILWLAPRKNGAQWNPLKNTADAIELAERAFGEEWNLQKHDGGYSFKGVTSDGKVGRSYHEETKQEAICNAVMQILSEGCNYIGKCVCCNEDEELLPVEEGGICQDCATLGEP
ncbi:hypothetical protein [Brevibacillus migulae]|uniref:hypothetical protein n=1 Tax=Brevibacillus migulae TaxID=1644114 RepID=UPI00106E8257|nr:hypothetical protein [Brevibacillus migulae]